MPAQTQEERKAETRSRLIAAAADLFARKGFHAVSAEAVADAADRTTGALYNHFGGKDGLLLALVEQWLSESAARILAGVEESPDLDGRLRALWSDSVAAQQADAELWLLLEFELWLHGARNAEFADRLAARYDDRRRNLAIPLQAWAKDEGIGRLRHPNAPPASSSRCCSARRCNNDSTPKRSRRPTSSPACARSWKEST